MSAQALGVAIAAELPPIEKLTLILLSDGAVCSSRSGESEEHIALADLQTLAFLVGVDGDTLRVAINSLVARGVMSACEEFPLDFFSSTEGYCLHLHEIPTVTVAESNVLKELRRRQ